MKLEVKDLCFSYGKNSVLKNINTTVKSGEVVGILGPNGVGKSTLFRCLLGFLRPNSGEVLIDGKNINTISKKELSAYMAYIPQSYNPVFNHTVLDTVLMGLTNQLGLFQVPSDIHEKKALEALNLLGIGHLKDRGSMKISGGERALMLVARALVQDAKILILDEPTANLDFKNACNVMKRITALAKEGYSVIISSHDPNQVLTYCSRIITLKDGSILSDAQNREISDKLLSKLYGVNIQKCDKCNNVSVVL